MKTRTYTEEQFVQAIVNNYSIRGALRELGLKPSGGNYTTLHLTVKKLGLDTSHWTGMGHLKGKHNTWTKKIPLETICVKDSTYGGGSYKLKNKLLKEGILERKCYCCEGIEWLSKPIPLELEHKNGDKFDNRIDNLSLLCPNCHALTLTYRGKNKKKKSVLVEWKLKPKKLKLLKTIPLSDLELTELAKIYSAVKIGIMFNMHEKTVVRILKKRNIVLSKKQYKKFDPTKEELEQTLQELNYNFCAAGRKYSVSDNAVRKRCKKLEVRYNGLIKE